MKTISKYSFGIGDWFAHEGVNQLKALIQAEKDFGVHFTPVWNIHVSFKVAAELKDEYLPALVRSADVIGAEISANIGARHVARLFR